MVSLNMLCLAAPKGMWASIINWIYSFTVNYGLTIILLTLFIKIVMMPLDFWQKYTQKKMQINQAKMAPELTTLNKRYANDKQLLNAKTMEVYKKHGVSPMGSCFSMLLNMGIVLAVFITLINSMNAMSAYKAQKQFLDLETVYEQTIDSGKTIPEAEAAVEDAFYNNKGIKEDFLWIKNIWRKETSESVIPEYKEVEKKDWKDNDGNKITEERYNKIMGNLQTKTKGQWNGYYILTVLVVGTSFLSSWILTRKPKEERVAGNATAPSQKITSFILPVVMGVFTLTASSTFALYLVVSQIISIGINLAINPIINKIIKKKRVKQEEDKKPKVNYSR